jgi:preprotein translocase subunit SecB
MKDVSGVIIFDGFKVERFRFDWDVSEKKENHAYRYNIAYTGQTFEDQSKQIDLIIRLFCNESDDYENSPVKLELILAGKFHQADDTAWDDRWDSNALAILFPYARSIIACFTAQTGLETINLPTVNTRALIRTETIMAESEENLSITKAMSQTELPLD